MKQYTETELEDLHKEILRMAEYFTGFCKEHDLLCYFCGGGCIGTIRNHGFIPWDDDLDFFMPRPDYQRLIALWDKESADKRFKMQVLTPTFRDHNNFVTIRDAETTLIKPYQRQLDIVHGVNLDIFPLDGCPAGKWQRKMQIVYAMLHSLYRTETVPVKHGRFIELGGRIALGIVPSAKMRARIWKWAERKMSQYPFDQCDRITELSSGPAYWHNEYEKAWFASALYLPFEDTVMPVPVGYDSYLRMVFGDYMSLPPNDKRIAKHDAVVLDTHKSYLNYREYYGPKAE